MPTNSDDKAMPFRERLGDKPLGLDDYKVDELRKLASEYHIPGSHGLKKPDLVNAINKARETETNDYEMSS